MTGLALALLIAAAPPPPLTLAGDAFWVHERQGNPPIGDAVLVNFEGGLCPPGVPVGGRALRKEKRWRLCMPRAAPTWLRQVGVVATGHENNHAEDGAPAQEDAAFAKLPIERLRLHKRPWERSPYEVWPAQDPAKDVQVQLSDLGRRAREAREKNGDLVVAYVHRTKPSYASALDRLARSGVPIVVGVGLHEAGSIRRVKGSWVFDDLGDLVMDCACSDGRYGLLVDLPGVPGEALVVRLVRAAHGPKDEVGAPVSPAIAERVLGRLSAGQPGARVVDGHLELEWPAPPPSELKRPVAEPQP